MPLNKGVHMASMCTGVESVEARARLRSAIAGSYYYRPLTQLLLADVVFTTPALPSGTHCHHT